MKKMTALLLCLVMLLCSTAAFAEPTGADVRGTGELLTMYTNGASSGRGEWITERAAEAGFSLAIMGEGSVTERLINEAANPIADVVFGLNAIMWNELISRDLVVSFDPPSWASEVSEGLNNPDGYYYATGKQAILLAYDLNQIDEEDAPRDWPDLWTNEKYFGRYEASGELHTGTTRNVIAGILTRYVDPNGDLGISDEGWEAIKAYYEHGVPKGANVDTYATFVNPDSQVIMGQMWSSGVVQYDEAYGTHTGVARPEVGVPYAVEALGIVKGTKHMDEALRFIEWFGSAEIQSEWAEKFGAMPANEVAAQNADPVQKELCSIPAQDIDWELVQEYIDQWCEKIELEYLP